MASIYTKGLTKKEYVTLMETHKEMLYRTAYGYLRDETLALDALDEAIYLGYRHRKSVREPEFAKTWLVRILINECLRILKEKKKVLPFEDISHVSENSGHIHEDSQEISLDTKLALETLPMDLKQVIILRYFSDETIADTAKILKIPEGTVSSRTRKALTLLKGELVIKEGGTSYV